MEAAIEVERIECEMTPYELERGKPTLDTIHAAVQMNLGVELTTGYRSRYRVLSELALATEPTGTTPDLAIYPAFALDYDNRQSQNPVPPRCCLEIQSPSQSVEEMVSKVRIYFEFGVKSCWVVQPAIRGVLVFDSSTTLRILPRR